jgi:ribose transport system permease protein
MTMVIVAAGIDLSVGSIIALSTVVIALLLKRDVSPLLAALGGVAGRRCAVSPTACSSRA